MSNEGVPQNWGDLFIESGYQHPQNKQWYKEYLLTRDGFSLLVYGTFENPLFLAKDVAEWIDYAFKDSRKVNRDVSKMLRTVDEDEKIKATMKLGGEDCSHGGVRENTEMWFLTEDGLYEVLMQSRKPIANG